MKDLRHGASVTVGPPSGLVADVLLGDALLASILNDHTLLGEPVAFIPTRGEDRVNKRFAASVIPGIACTVRILIGPVTWGPSTGARGGALCSARRAQGHGDGLCPPPWQRIQTWS